MLETLTALAVLSLTMSALLDAYTNGLRGAGASERKVHANILAQSLLTEVLNSPIRIAGTSSGDYETFKWEIKTVLTDRIQSGEGRSLKKLGLYQVIVSVGNTSGKIVELKAAKVGGINE